MRRRSQADSCSLQPGFSLHFWHCAPAHKGKLLLAGILWSFSIATRSTQLVPIAFMTALTWLYLFHRCRRTNSMQALGRLSAALIAPLAVCGAILAWYNWARFDSILEFGLYYQLAAFNLQAN